MHMRAFQYKIKTSFEEKIMKCQNCGYIASREFYRCPYCGHINESESDVLKTTLKFGGGFAVRIRTIIYGVLVNLFSLSVMVDWFLDFKYSITLWSFILCFGFAAVFSIATSRRKTLMSAAERFDLYFLLILILAPGLFRISGVFDFRALSAGIIMPAYLIVAAGVSVVLLLRSKANSLRPLLTEVLLIFHAVIATLLFVFLLVNKYSVMTGSTNPPFHYLQFGMTAENSTPMYLAAEILIFSAFGISWAYLINYNIMLVGFIYRKVVHLYGGSGD